MCPLQSTIKLMVFPQLFVVQIEKALPVSFPFAQFELSLKETQALHSTKEQKMALASFTFLETAATHHGNGFEGGCDPVNIVFN